MGILKVMIKSEAKRDYLFHCYNYVTGGHTILDYYGGINICPDRAVQQMIAVKRYFGKLSGNQLIHFVVSYDRRVCDADTAMSYTYRIAQYYSDRYQIIFGMHDTQHFRQSKRVASYYHTHIIMNSVSFVDGKMFADGWSDINDFVSHIRNVTGDARWRVVYGDKESSV